MSLPASLGTTPAPGRLRLELSTLLCSMVLLVLAFVVVYPLFLLLVNSFQVNPLGAEVVWGLNQWTSTLGEPSLAATLGTTFSLALVRQVIAILIGLPIAWLVARTDLPGRRWLEFGFWVAVFLPSLTVLVGWILLLDGYRGVANKLIEGLFGVTQGPIDVFSAWGIVFVHVMGATLGIKVMFLAPAFRALDSTLEEASHACGAGTLKTLARVSAPLMLPAILVATLLGLINSLESFEVELVLGAPAGIDVFSTKVYRLVRQEPPLYGSATALSSVILFAMIPLILLQQWLVSRRSYVTVSGKFHAQLHWLGRWRWPLFGLVATLVGVMTVLPTVLVVVGSFMKVFGAFEARQPWTTRNWELVLGSSEFLGALANTLVLAGSVALLSGFGLTLLAYISVRTRFAGRGVIDFLTWVPSLLPGIVVSLGMLWMFLETPVFRPLYGSMAVLVVAVALSGLTRSVQMAKASLVQLGPELEEASWACGGSWLTTMRRVILPLVAPMIAVVALVAFTTASRTASHVALLASASNRPLALYQLDLLANGKFEAAAVVGVIVLALTIGVALVAKLLRLDLAGGGE